MAVLPPLYKLFPLRPSAAQTSLDALVSALWCRLFLGQDFGRNHWLNKIFAKMSQWPVSASLQLCPYYFDQVTYRLPTREQVKHNLDAIMSDLPPTCGLKGELQPEAALLRLMDRLQRGEAEGH